MMSLRGAWSYLEVIEMNKMNIIYDLVFFSSAQTAQQVNVLHITLLSAYGSYKEGQLLNSSFYVAFCDVAQASLIGYGWTIILHKLLCIVIYMWRKVRSVHPVLCSQYFLM